MPNDRLHKRVAMSYHRVTLRICLVLLLFTIHDVVNFDIPRQRRSGVQNGDDQTTIHTLTTEEKLALEYELLKHLGLQGKPQRANSTGSLIKASAQKFLLDVYKNKVDKRSETRPNDIAEPSEFDLTGNDLRTIDKSDSIMTFTAQQRHQKVGGSPDNLMAMWFDVKAVPTEDRMISAELRLYRRRNAKKRKNRGAFTVTAYRALHTKDSGIEMQFVDSANTTAGHEGWITLNVRESLLHWTKHPDDNKGLYLSVRPTDRSSHETRPKDIGIVGFEGDVGRQPFMAGFFRSNESDKAGLLRASTLESFGDYDKRNKKRDTSRRKSDSSCNVKRHYVSFKDIHWDEWLIAPEGYNANYCSGECNSMNELAFHGMIEHFVNYWHPGKMPKTGCVPTKLSGMDVLYYIDRETVVLKRWKNMSVKACGCV